jgi:hypothetical protein
MMRNFPRIMVIGGKILSWLHTGYTINENNLLYLAAQWASFCFQFRKLHEESESGPKILKKVYFQAQIGLFVF